MDELTIYKFQPDAMDRETLEKIFVGDKQKQLLERLYEEIKEAAKARKPKYYLIVGPRGIGKTHLITLLYYRLSGVEEVFPVKLSEEEFSIYRVSDLLQRVWEVAEQDRAIYQKFANVSEDNLVVILLEELKKPKKSLVLFIENLDQIIGKQMRESEVKRLRSLLQTENMFIVVATAPLIFPEVSSHEAPFFGFFEILHISELTRDELKELLRRLAELEENADFLRRIGELEHRIDAITTLTGGNPRIAILLYDLTKVGKLLDVEKAFFRILDDYTPYYQDLFKMLSGEQRKIFDELISIGRPATPKELALWARLPQNVVNSQLRRLERDGFVISHKVGRKTHYEVKDKLFRLWRELRKEPFGRKKLSILIKFLEVWYSVEERLEILSKYIRDIEKLKKEHILREVIYWFLSLPIQYKRKFLPDLVTKCFEIGKEQILETIACDETLKKEIHKQIVLMFDKGKYKELLSTINSALKLDKNNVLMWIAKGITLTLLDRCEEGLRAIEKAIELDPKNKIAWDIKARILLIIGRIEEALQTSSICVEIDPSDWTAWELHSLVLERLSRIEESLEAAEKAVELAPDHPDTWKRKGEILLRMKMYEEALETFSKAIKLNPKDARVWNAKGFTLGLAGRERDAREAFLKVLSLTDQAIEPKPINADSLIERAFALAALGKFKDAASTILNVTSLMPNAKVKQFVTKSAVEFILLDSFLELKKQNIRNSMDSLKRAIEIIRKSELTEQQIKTTTEELTRFLIKVTNLRNIEALRLIINEISNSLDFSKEFITPFKVALEIVETGDINKYYGVQMELRDIVAKIVAKLTGSDKLAPPKEQK